MRRATRRYRRTVIESFGQPIESRLDRLREFVDRPVVQGTAAAMVLLCGIAIGLIVARWLA